LPFVALDASSAPTTGVQENTCRSGTPVPVTSTVESNVPGELNEKLPLGVS
jgi:hypothetical protein